MTWILNLSDWGFFFLYLFCVGVIGLPVMAILWFSGTLARIEERRERAVLDSMPKDLTTCPGCKELHDRSSFFCSIKCERACFLIHHEPVSIIDPHHAGGAHGVARPTFENPLPTAVGDFHNQETKKEHTT